MKRLGQFKVSKRNIYIFSGVILIYFFFFMPVPFVIYGPGEVIALKPLVSTGHTFKEEGEIKMTTVNQTFPNVTRLVTAMWDPYLQVTKKADSLCGKRKEVYENNQKKMMLSSQLYAQLAAYHFLNIPYQINETGHITAQSPLDNVHFKATEVGGPSAGFMLALEIVNQLLPSDLTKGYRVVGTGTIDEGGHIGAIGGIRHKVIAASHDLADIFFLPYANLQEAQDQLTEFGIEMNLVPVKTLQEAVNYLTAFPAKKQGA